MLISVCVGWKKVKEPPKSVTSHTSVTKIHGEKLRSDRIAEFYARTHTTNTTHYYLRCCSSSSSSGFILGDGKKVSFNTTRGYPDRSRTALDVVVVPQMIDDTGTKPTTTGTL